MCGSGRQDMKRNVSASQLLTLSCGSSYLTRAMKGIQSTVVVLQRELKLSLTPGCSVSI